MCHVHVHPALLLQPEQQRVPSHAWQAHARQARRAHARHARHGVGIGKCVCPRYLSLGKRLAHPCCSEQLAHFVTWRELQRGVALRIDGARHSAAIEE